MREIIGNTTATPNPRPDWNQTDETKADYIKNKPNIAAYQETVDNTLETTDKTIVGAINEVNKKAGQSSGDDLTEEQVEEIIAETYLKGDTAPTTETAAEFVGQLYVKGNATYQCTAITTDESTGVKSYTWVQLIRATNYANDSRGGVVKTHTYGYKGVQTLSDGQLIIVKASNSEINAKGNNNVQGTYRPIVPANLDHAVKVGLTTNTETLADEEQTSACEWLGAVKKDTSARSSNSIDARVYGIDKDGNQVVYECQYRNKGNTIPYRDSNGQILVSHPIMAESATPKRYIDNLPDYLTLTEEQKAKWQAWLGITVAGKMVQSIGEVGAFYPIIQGTKSFSETAITPELGMLYYDVLTHILYNWSGTSYIVQAEFQLKYEDTLETEDKTVPGAINELKKKIDNGGSTGESAKLYEHHYTIHALLQGHEYYCYLSLSFLSTQSTSVFTEGASDNLTEFKNFLINNGGSKYSMSGYATDFGTYDIILANIYSAHYSSGTDVCDFNALLPSMEINVIKISALQKASASIREVK